METLLLIINFTKTFIILTLIWLMKDMDKELENIIEELIFEKNKNLQKNEKEKNKLSG